MTGKNWITLLQSLFSVTVLGIVGRSRQWQAYVLSFPKPVKTYLFHKLETKHVVHNAGLNEVLLGCTIGTNICVQITLILSKFQGVMAGNQCEGF